MIGDIKEKVVYDFLHLFFSGHLKREELGKYLSDYLTESPKEFRMRVMDDIVILQDTFQDVLFEVMENFESEFEVWEGAEIMREFAAHHKIHELNDIKNRKYFTINEDADMLKKTTRTINNYVDSKKLTKEYVDDKPYIVGDSLRKLMLNLK